MSEKTQKVSSHHYHDHNEIICIIFKCWPGNVSKKQKKEREKNEFYLIRRIPNVAGCKHEFPSNKKNFFYLFCVWFDLDAYKSCVGIHSKMYGILNFTPIRQISNTLSFKFKIQKTNKINFITIVEVYFCTYDCQNLLEALFCISLFEPS